MKFLEYTKELNKLVINLGDKEEIIDEEDLIKAIFYMNNMYIDDTGDCLIFLSALNLCNSYVKQDKSRIGYTFKKGIEYIINVLNFYNDKKPITRTLLVDNDVGLRNPESISVNVNGTRTQEGLEKDNDYLKAFDFEYVDKNLNEIKVKEEM